MSTPRVKGNPELRPLASAPLTAVVHDAVRRWFQETHKEAQRGDVVTALTVILNPYISSAQFSILNTPLGRIHQ